MLIEWITYHNLMLCVMSICEQNAVIFRFALACRRCMVSALTALEWHPLKSAGYSVMGV